MTASVTFLSALVYVAISATVITPMILIVLFIRDLMKGDVW